jgi:hypothetical protein
VSDAEKMKVDEPVYRPTPAECKALRMREPLADATAQPDELVRRYPTIARLADVSRSTTGYQSDELIREAVHCLHELRHQEEATARANEGWDFHVESATLLQKRAEQAEARVLEMQRERDARNKIDPITRMHNLCDHLAEHRNESPYNAEALDLADESFREKCAELKQAEASAEAMRAALAECLVTLRHARVFIGSREKMHPDGQQLYEDCIAAARAAMGESKP